MAVERGQAGQGQTVRLRIRFEAGGTLFDPYEVRQVEILDPSDVLLATIPTASIVKDSVGLYHVDWAIPGGAATALHHDRWYARSTVGAVEKQFTLAFFVLPFTAMASSSPYMTAAEILAYLPADTPLSATEAAGLGALAQEIVETITGDWFLPRQMARVFDGTGYPVLPVDLNIQSVSALEYLYGTTWQAQGIAGVRIAGSGKKLLLGNVTSFSQSLRRRRTWDDYRLGLTGDCGVFPPGSQNIRVTGDWGRFATVPLEIKAAIGLLVRYSGSCLESGEKGVPENPYLSESVAGGRAYVLRTIWSKAAVNRGTGFADVDGILARIPGPMTVVTVI